MKCPKCGSEQITIQKKGFSAGKAILGAVLVGPVGLVGGAIGANNIKAICLNCGHSFDIKKGVKVQAESQNKYDYDKCIKEIEERKRARTAARKGKTTEELAEMDRQEEEAYEKQRKINKEKERELNNQNNPFNIGCLVVIFIIICLIIFR